MAEDTRPLAPLLVLIEAELRVCIIDAGEDAGTRDWSPGSYRAQLRKLLREIRAQRQQVAALTADLAQCFRLTGEDPDGNEDWRLAPLAVESVKRMREGSDSDLDKLDQVRADLAALREAALKLVGPRPVLDYCDTCGRGGKQHEADCEFAALAALVRPTPEGETSQKPTAPSRCTCGCLAPDDSSLHWANCGVFKVAGEETPRG